MGVRVKRITNNANVDDNPIPVDSSLDQRETTVDGYTFHWGPNEVRNFLDDGVGAAHAAFDQAANVPIVEDTKPFGTSRS